MAITNVYNKAILTKKIRIPLNSIGNNLVDNLKIILKRKYEGLCNVDGYIKYNSINIITHSAGLINGNNIIFDVVFECQLCLPVEDSIISAVVKNITKAGIRAEIINQNEPTPIVVFITRDYNYNFKEVNIGDNILAKIIGTRFELNDKYISVIAEFVDEKEDMTSDNHSSPLEEQENSDEEDKNIDEYKKDDSEEDDSEEDDSEEDDNKEDDSKNSKEPPQESMKKDSKEPPQESMKKDSKEPPQESMKKDSKEPPQESMKKDSKEPVE
jgi:DNA-directed RNA polymerase subunit E'/Rpb7